jgi:hypothetical protein
LFRWGFQDGHGHPDQRWNHVDGSKQKLQALFPREAWAILFDFEGAGLHDMFQNKNHNLPRLPEFRSWAAQRIQSSHLADLGIQGERVVTVLKGLFADKNTWEAMGVVHLAWMHIAMLLREWILLGESLPYALQHLRGESLPWLLDSPFGPLDILGRQIGADLLARSGSQVCIAISPNEFPPVETILAPRVGQLCVLKVGDIPFGSDSVEAFGRTLVLSRCDQTEFSEIIPVEANPSPALGRPKRDARS